MLACQRTELQGILADPTAKEALIKELLDLRPEESATKKPPKRIVQPNGSSKKPQEEAAADKDENEDEDKDNEPEANVDDDDQNNPENVTDFKKAYAKVDCLAQGSL